MTPSTDDLGLGRFLTLADAAEVLAISATEVHELITNGELPAIRVGTRAQWRIDRSELEGYIENKYEETRRWSLWNQADFTGLLDFESSRDRAE